MADSKADRALRIAQHSLNRLTRNEQEDLNKIVTAEVQTAFKKGRYDTAEVMETFGTTQPGYMTNIVDSTLDPRKYYGQGNIIEPDIDDMHAPVDFSGPDVEAPTSTGKIDRPRTFAAAYDEGRSVLTIVFSTGKIYNYYDVSRAEWNGFHGSQSKWKYIKDVLDPKPRGYASEANLSPELQAFAARSYRTQQIVKSMKRRK
jgi:hypothetical protein